MMTAVVLSAVAHFSTSDEPSRSWSDREIFVVGSDVFDFRKGKLGYGSEVHRLSDCSTPSHFCGKSDVLSIILPRVCADAEAESERYRSSDFEIRKAGSIMTYVGHPASDKERAYLLVNDAQPWVVFEYVPVHGIIGYLADYSSLNKQDFRISIKNGTYENLKSPYLKKSFEYSSLRSFDSMGACL